MLNLRFRKREELTKEFWIGTIEWIGVGIGLVFVCSVLFSLIPPIYENSPDIRKLVIGLLFCGGVFVGIAYMLRRIWHIESK
jgi:hypothetical protein